MQMHTTQTTGSVTCFGCSPRFLAAFGLLLMALGAPVVAQPESSATALTLGSTANAGQPGGDVTLEVISVWGGPVNTIHVEGNLAYIGSGRRMVILDITDFENITEVGSIKLLDTVEGLVVRDGYAYIAIKSDIPSGGFCTIDVSDISNLRLAWCSDVPGTYQPRSVKLYGNIAYVGPEGEGGSPMRAFDITDPENGIDLGDGVVFTHEESAIEGDLLFTADKHPGIELAIYDLTTDPLNPALLGELDLAGLNVVATHIAVDQDIACLLVHDTQGDFGSEFLAIIDVSSTSSPVLVGTYALTPPNIVESGVDVAGGLAYVANEVNGLIILDITTDPSNPTIVGSFDTHGFARRVSVIGERAYLSDDGEGLIILDVSDPTEPVRLGGYHSPTDLRKMKKIGDLLYVSDVWNGFTILDVSDPHATPTVVGVYQTTNSVPFTNFEGNWGIDVRDGLAYLSEGGNGLEVVDVSNPQNPVLVGAVGVGGNAMDLKLNPRMEPPFTNVLHVGTEPGAWLVNFDVSDPSNITEIGRAFLGNGQVRVHDIAVTPDGQYAHVAKSAPPGGWGVQIVDVSDPTAPGVINGDLLGADPIDIALDGDIRYIASSDDIGCDTEGDLHIQDISDPTNPIDLSIVDWCYGDLGIRRVSAVAVSNDRAYVVASFSPPDTGGSYNHIVAFDVTDPSAPVLLNWVKAGANTKTALLVDDPYLFVTTRTGSVRSEGLVIIEVVVAGTCPWDLDSNGSVGVKDLLFLLGTWGPCPKKGDCPADFDNSGDVGVKDLLFLLGAWGPCP